MDLGTLLLVAAIILGAYLAFAIFKKVAKVFIFLTILLLGVIVLIAFYLGIF